MRGDKSLPTRSGTIAMIAITGFFFVAYLSSGGNLHENKVYHTTTPVVKDQSDDHSKKRGLRFASLSKTIFLKENKDHLHNKFVKEEHPGEKDDDEVMYDGRKMIFFKKGNGGIISSDDDRMVALKTNGDHYDKVEQLLIRFFSKEEVSSLIRGPTQEVIDGYHSGCYTLLLLAEFLLFLSSTFRKKVAYILLLFFSCLLSSK